MQQMTELISFDQILEFLMTVVFIVIYRFFKFKICKKKKKLKNRQ